MKVFHIEQFKCTLCSNWFCPPYNLPYLLKCTHSICTNCLQKSVTSKCKQIICPEDLEANKLSQININQSTKKALQRLMKEHKNFNDTNYLQCIKTLSINFDQILDTKQVELKNFSQLINQIFEDQIKRLKGVYQKIKLQINRPFRVVNDWKDVVKTYLTKIKRSGSNNSKMHMSQLSHYIQEGRNIKMDLNQFSKYNFKQYTNLLIQHPEVCFKHNFSVFDSIKKATLNKANSKNSVQQPLDLRGRQSNTFQNKFLPNNTQSLNQYGKDGKQISLFEKITNKTPRQQLQRDCQTQKENRLGKLIFSQSVSQLDQAIKKSNNQSNSKNLHQSRSPFSMTEQKWINSKFQSPQRQFKPSKDFDKLKQKLQNVKQKQQNNRQVLKEIQLRSNKTHNIRGNQKVSLKQSLEYSPEAAYQNYTFQDSSSKIKVQSSPTKYQQHLRRYENNDYDQILLEEENNPVISQNSQWHLQNYNFLKQWQIHNQKRGQSELQIKQRIGYNCQKQKEKYTKKIQLQRAKQAYDQTMQKTNIVELINCQLDFVDLNAYLSNFNWTQVQILKLVRTSLKDSQMNQLLNYLACSNVHTLVLSSNNLTEVCIDALLYFVQVNKVLKNVYLSKNNINTLKGHTRAKIQILKQHGINLYI